MTITLPIPPSANRYWRVVRGRMVVSAEARAYKRTAAILAQETGIQPIRGAVAVAVDVFRARRAGDLDNFLKVCLDSMKGIAFEDDSQVVTIKARRFDDRDNPRVEITFSEAGA